MSDKLNELGDFLGKQIEKLEGLKVVNPTLKEIQLDADQFFEGLDYTERQKRSYIESLMAGKIVELEKTVEVLRNQLINR